MMEAITAGLLMQNVKLRRKVEKLEALAVTDELTGLLNRRGIVAALDAAARRSTRQPGNLFSVIMLDIDHFKLINDTHGHDTGDSALRLMGCALREFTRANESAGRWGGEEFLIVTETGLAEALLFAERLCHAIRTTVYVRLPDFLTASFGVAESALGESWENTVKAADAAMYRAKAEGRNTVRSA